jgi:threonyl-tRNA synthetase
MVYRDEQSGELSGLSRVRAITQDDAHVFCRLQQVEEEIGKIWNIINRLNATFGIELKVRLSRHDPEQMDKYIGDAAMWKRAEDQLRAVIEAKGVEYTDGLGEAAFYGPKIDFMGRDALGREFQAGTIQLDFGQPENFDLTCNNESGEKERIVMIHAAIMGSIERFMVLVIEQTAGAFPTWLAPEQVRLAPINETDVILDYTEKLRGEFEAIGIRTSVDNAPESVGKKIRAAGLAKVPYTLVIGEKERETGQVSPRLRTGHGEFEGSMSVEDFAAAVLREVSERAPKSVL